MTGNSDGLSPTLKPFLGVGHNRALPAPFGFDNGVFPDGANDWLNLSSFNGKTLPPIGSIEFWVKFTENGAFMFFSMASANGQVYQIEYNSSIRLRQPNPLGTGIILTNGAKYHIVINYGATTSTIFINGANLSTLSATPFALNQLTDFRMFHNLGIGTITNFSKSGIDEFRFYDRNLTQAEISLHYNNGIGENPVTTESLVVWYKFQEFETLDFSPLQDNSDMRLAVRDHSGKNNHVQPVNMDTNPASPTYVLKPF